MSASFILEYWQEEGWYVGRLRGVPGAFSQGQTLEDLDDNVRDAYRLMLEDEEAAPGDAQTKAMAIES